MSRGPRNPNVTAGEFPVLVLRVVFAMDRYQVARALGRSEHTVRHQWSSILKKLQVPAAAHERIWILNEICCDRFGE